MSISQLSQWTSDPTILLDRCTLYALRCSRALDASHPAPTLTLRSPLSQTPAEASQGLNRGSQGASDVWGPCFTNLYRLHSCEKTSEKVQIKKIILFLHSLSLPVSFLDS